MVPYLVPYLVPEERENPWVKLQRNRIPRVRSNLKLLSSGCHKISTALSGPYGNRARCRSIHSRNLHRNGENFRRCQSAWREMPLSPSCDGDISRSCLVIQYFSLYYARSLHPRPFFPDRNDQYHLPALPSVTNKSVSRFLNGGYHTHTMRYVYIHIVWLTRERVERDSTFN